LAKLVRTDFGTSKPVGGSSIDHHNSARPTDNHWRIYLHLVAGILLGRHWAKGTSLISKYNPSIAQGIVVSDGVMINNGAIVSDGIVVSDGVTGYNGTIVSNGSSLAMALSLRWPIVVKRRPSP